mmetsp:Transcript_8327/g.23344  ORF Transcript_8327/g.23344 Transcript_8327/m.23344 type:complete len:286 (-) Transcript_8327:225-1082(-)
MDHHIALVREYFVNHLHGRAQDGAHVVVPAGIGHVLHPRSRLILFDVVHGGAHGPPRVAHAVDVVYAPEDQLAPRVPLEAAAAGLVRPGALPGPQVDDQQVAVVLRAGASPDVLHHPLVVHALLAHDPLRRLGAPPQRRVAHLGAAAPAHGGYPAPLSEACHRPYLRLGQPARKYQTSGIAGAQAERLVEARQLPRRRGVREHVRLHAHAGVLRDGVVDVPPVRAVHGEPVAPHLLGVLEREQERRVARRAKGPDRLHNVRHVPLRGQQEVERTEVFGGDLQPEL